MSIRANIAKGNIMKIVETNVGKMETEQEIRNERL